jgi:hypothetical protein
MSIADLHDSFFAISCVSLPQPAKEEDPSLVIVLGLAVLCLQLLCNHNSSGDECFDIGYCIVLCDINSQQCPSHEGETAANKPHHNNPQAYASSENLLRFQQKMNGRESSSSSSVRSLANIPCYNFPVAKTPSNQNGTCDLIHHIANLNSARCDQICSSSNSLSRSSLQIQILVAYGCC